MTSASWPASVTQSSLTASDILLQMLGWCNLNQFLTQKIWDVMTSASWNSSVTQRNFLTRFRPKTPEDTIHISKSISGTVWSGGANSSLSSGELSLPSRSQGWCSVSSELSRSHGSLLSRDRMRHLALGDRVSGVTNWPRLILRKREACSLSLNGYLETQRRGVES